MVPKRNSIWEIIPGIISAQIYKYFTWLSPNTITIASGISGILGLVIIMSNKLSNSFIIGGVLIILFLIFDFVDGDVARATGKKTTIGAWLDPFFDKIVEGLILVTAGYYALNENLNLETYLFVAFSIVLFQLNQFLLLMDNLILTQMNKHPKSVEFSFTDKNSFNLNLLLKHISLGHAALVISFILFSIFNLIEYASITYFCWSGLSLIPTIIAKLRPLFTCSTLN